MNREMVEDAVVLKSLLQLSFYIKGFEIKHFMYFFSRKMKVG